MIPIFPTVTKLQLTHKKSLQQAVEEVGSHSDFNFPGLWTYDTEGKVYLSRLNGNLVIKTRDYLTYEPFYSFLGHNNVIDTISKLLRHAKKEGITPSVKLVHEQIISSVDISNLFKVNEDRDNLDYILSISELVDLSGEKYHKHRKLIHKFTKLYPSILPHVLDLADKHIQSDITGLFHNWEHIKQKDKDESENELKAIRRVFDDAQYLDFMATGLYDKDALIAFFIFDVGGKEYSYSHFFKSLPSYTGALQVLRQFSARILKKKGVIYLNIEQDLGVPGLRFAKEQWNPVAYIKKYSISPKA